MCVCVCRCVFERNVSIDGSKQENILIHYLSENIEKVITRTEDDKTVIKSVGAKEMPLLSSGEIETAMQISQSEQNDREREKIHSFLFFSLSPSQNIVLDGSTALLKL